MSSLIGNKPNQIPTNADLGKLAFLNALPTATTSILGGVKVDGTSIASTNGVISVGTTVSTSTLTVSSSLILPNTSSLPASPATGNLRYNTTSNKFEGYSSVGWGSIGGGGLTPTPVKIAAYTAVANDLVRCNTSGGAFSITLPSSPADGDIVGIIDTNNSFSSFNLTILPTVGKTIEGDSTSFILDVNGSYASFVYVLATVSTGNWKLQGTPLSTSPVLTASTSVLGLVKVDGTTITVNGSGVISASASATKTIVNTAVAYNVTATDLGKIINCTSGTFTVSLTAAATLGSGFVCTIWNSATTSTDAITIDPSSAETIDGKSTLILRRGEGMDIICDGTNWQIDNKKPMRGYTENLLNTMVRPFADGLNSIAIGEGAGTSGSYGISAGYYARSPGTMGTALGGWSNNGSAYGTAIGTNSAGNGSTTATNSGAMALGGSYASGTDSFAAAVNNTTTTYGAKGANSIAIGFYCSASAQNSVAIGRNCFASGTSSVAIGGDSSYGNSAEAAQSVMIGFGGRAFKYGQYGFSCGLFTTAGDAQYSNMVLRATTTTTTAVVLTSNAGAASTTNQVILSNNSVYGFTGTISAMQSAAGGTDFAIWEVKGGIRRGASAAAMTLGSYNINILSKSSGATAWTVALSADTTNGGLAITVTGAASVNIRWVASITTSEVTYA